MANPPDPVQSFIQQHFPDLGGDERAELQRMLQEIGSSPEELQEMGGMVDKLQKMFESSDRLPDELANLLNLDDPNGLGSLLSSAADELLENVANAVGQMPEDVKSEMEKAFREMGLPSFDEFLKMTAEGEQENGAQATSSEPVVVDAEKDFLSPLNR